MPSFHWKGRSGAHTIEGDLVAHSKEDVIARLRKQGIAVTEVTEGKSRGEPLDPDLRPQPSLTPVETAPRSLEEELERGRKQPRHPFRGVLVAIAFVVAAIVVGAMAPIVFCKCERANGQVVCTIKDRILGVVPMREQTLAGVMSVDTETQFWRDKNREHSKTRIILHDARGATIRPFSWDQNGTLGTTSDQMRTLIDDFLRDANAKSIALWQGQWVPLVMPACLLLIALMMVAVTIIALNQSWTDRFYDAVGKFAKQADRRRKLHHP